MSTGLLVAIVTIVGTLAFCGIVVWLVLKNMKKQTYKGVVSAKNEGEIEGSDDSAATYYVLVVKTDDGMQKKVRVGKKIWDQFKVGDKIIKESGKYNPTKG